MLPLPKPKPKPKPRCRYSVYWTCFTTVQKYKYWHVWSTTRHTTLHRACLTLTKPLSLTKRLTLTKSLSLTKPLSLTNLSMCRPRWLATQHRAYLWIRFCLTTQHRTYLWFQFDFSSKVCLFDFSSKVMCSIETFLKWNGNLPKMETDASFLWNQTKIVRRHNRGRNWSIKRQRMDWKTLSQLVEEGDPIIYLNGKIEFEVEQCLFIAKLWIKQERAITYIVGYVDDLIVADRSNQTRWSWLQTNNGMYTKILESGRWRKPDTILWCSLDM